MMDRLRSLIETFCAVPGLSGTAGERVSDVAKAQSTGTRAVPGPTGAYGPLRRHISPSVAHHTACCQACAGGQTPAMRRARLPVRYGAGSRACSAARCRQPTRRLPPHMPR